MLPIKHLTIHCAATPEGRDVKASQLNSWAVAKFGQKSYHYIIELDGTIKQNLRHDQIGAHTGGKNTGNLGICYVGGMTSDMKKAKDTRTVAQKVALTRLVAELRCTYPKITVQGHRDWPGVKKDCPSFDVKKEFK